MLEGDLWQVTEIPFTCGSLLSKTAPRKSPWFPVTLSSLSLIQATLRPGVILGITVSHLSVSFISSCPVSSSRASSPTYFVQLYNCFSFSGNSRVSTGSVFGHRYSILARRGNHPALGFPLNMGVRGVGGEQKQTTLAYPV